MNMKKITALEVQKKNPNRVNVHLDGEFAFGLARITAVWLKVGDTLSDEKLAALQAVALPTGDTIEDENKILRQAIMDVGTKLLHLAPASDTQTAHPDATNDTGRVQDRAAS